MSAEDFFVVINYLLRLRKDVGRVDDIDNLGNRRVRAVGELLENQFPHRSGPHGARHQREDVGASGHRLGHAARPDQLQAGHRRDQGVLRIVASSRSSWIRRTRSPRSRTSAACSALGPGGLSRERAGFEVRDVHPTHYGRICPIETPEGPNIGLISSLACYARINEYGFIESPYKK